MRVIEKDNQLIVQSRLRSLFALPLFGLIFAASGLFAFWIGGRTAVLECVRLEAREVRCDIQETLLNLPVRSAEVLNPQQAVVDIDEDSEGDTYRVVLVTARGAVPLAEIYTDDAPVDRLSTEINQFLQDPTAKTLRVTQPPGVWIYLFPLCFGGAGLAMLLAMSFDTYVFDRDREALLIKRQSLHGTRQSEEPLSGLTVLVREHSDSEGTSYSVQAQTRSGREIKMGDFNSHGGAQRLAQQIEDFIKPGVRIRYVEVDERSDV